MKQAANQGGVRRRLSPGPLNTARNGVRLGAPGKMLYGGYSNVRNGDVRNRTVHTMFCQARRPCRTNAAADSSVSGTKWSIVSGPERNQDGCAGAPPNGAG